MYEPSQEAKDTIKRWFQKIDQYKAKVKAHIPLTKEEQDDWDFMEQKLDDWKSDYYGQAGL